MKPDFLLYHVNLFSPVTKENNAPDSFLSIVIMSKAIVFTNMLLDLK